MKRLKRVLPGRAVQSLALTALILLSLVMLNVGPAGAIDLSITGLTNMCTGVTKTFYVQVDIAADEHVPITGLRLDIDGPSPTYVEFDVDGTITDNDGYIQSIELQTTYYYTYGYGYASGYGYYGGYGDFSYNWGYGYGYHGDGSPASLTYKVVIKTTGMSTGSYTARLRAFVSPDPEFFISPVYTFNIVSCGGGGGGDPLPTPTPDATPIPTPAPEPGSVEVDVMGTTADWSVGSDGALQDDVNVSSPDGGVSINISSGTVMLDKDGQPLGSLSVEAVDPLPEPPEGGHVLAAFDFGPDGATFDPGMQITIAFDPNDIPEGMDTGDLVIAIYDSETGEWQYLSGTVDAENNTITFTVTHFTIFGLLAVTEDIPDITPTPTPTATVPAPTPTATPTVVPPVVPVEKDSPEDWVWIVFGVIGALVLVMLVALFMGIATRNKRKKKARLQKARKAKLQKAKSRPRKRNDF